MMATWLRVRPNETTVSATFLSEARAKGITVFDFTEIEDLVRRGRCLSHARARQQDLLLTYQQRLTANTCCCQALDFDPRLQRALPAPLPVEVRRYLTPPWVGGAWTGRFTLTQHVPSSLLCYAADVQAGQTTNGNKRSAPSESPETQVSCGLVVGPC